MADAPDRHARVILPIPHCPSTTVDHVRRQGPQRPPLPPIQPLRPPGGAPNVVVILLDDVGFGAACQAVGRARHADGRAAGCGGPAVQPLPHDRPVRADVGQALLTGRNHHSAGMGSITETATSAPGQSSMRPNTMAPLALTLTLNGYSTAQFGKCQARRPVPGRPPRWGRSMRGRRRAGGSSTFYGFIGGENNQWDPALYDGTTPIEPPASGGGGLSPHRRPHRPLR